MRTVARGIVAFGLALLMPGRDPAAQQKIELKKPGRQEARKGLLAGLPSAPGGHLNRIRALKDGEWINLGSPAPDPKWGKARGRSWSCKMPYAPDLQGAFLNGQGVHGYIKPDGYFMDDIWFYDLNAHRWICLYPGTNTKTLVENIQKGDLKMSPLGQLVDKDGHAVPFSSIPGHSYQVHTYDPDLQQYLFAVGHGGIGDEQHVRDQPWCKDGKKLLAAQGKADRVLGSPYSFNARTGHFERAAMDGVAPKLYTLAVMFYLPSKKALFHYEGGRTLFRDSATNRWVDAGAKGPTPPGSADLGACYDSKRDRLYLGRGNYPPPLRPNEGFVYIYDVRTNTWSNPPNKEGASNFPATNYGWTNYDAANDRVVAMYHFDGKGGLTTYDPGSETWGSPGAVPPEVLGNRGCIHAFYSPEVNAHFVYLAGDSDDNGTMWAYRYKNAKK